MELIVLQNRELFRKVYKYKTYEQDQINRVTREAEIALTLKQQTQNIALVLFAFQREDEDFKYIELVFPRYQTDLGSLLSQSAQPQDHPLDDPLWNGMIGVFEALAVMHRAIDTDELNCKGHFDISLSNILQEIPGEPPGPGGGSGTLLLTDFGQAAANQAGADDYAPPEKSVERERPQKYLKTSYDIWSMACVLMQVLVFLTKGDKEKKDFDMRRRNATNAAFWQFQDDGKITLRPEVTKRLNELERHGDQHDLRMQNIIATLRKMLSIKQDKRPPTTLCLARLKCPRDQELIECKLYNWQTSYGFHGTRERCRLYIYRDQHGHVRKGVIEEVTLDN